MNTRPNENSQASALAAMLAAGSLPANPWENDELALVLRHQLKARLAVDLGSIRGVAPEEVSRLALAADPPIHTFADLLRHPLPPLQLLEWTKRFAKRERAAGRGTIPAEIAAVLYFGSIQIARDRCSSRISNLADEQVRQGVHWILSQSWLDPQTRSLFDDAYGTTR